MHCEPARKMIANEHYSTNLINVQASRKSQTNYGKLLFSIISSKRVRICLHETHIILYNKNAVVDRRPTMKISSMNIHLTKIFLSGSSGINNKYYII